MYIISIDDDCSPAKDNDGDIVDIVTQHMTNLKTPATPLFCNKLYDSYRKGADFVCGYPFSIRSGVPCVLSCVLSFGLCLNLADYDAPTQGLKPEMRNARYVDAVMTVPKNSMMPINGINIAFACEVVGPAILPSLKLAKEGKSRWETMVDVWCGLMVKVVCDHLKLGVKTGILYVWRNERGSVNSLEKEWEGVKLMEELVPFFQTFKLSAVTAEACVTEMAAELNGTKWSHPGFAGNMVERVKIWKEVECRVLG